jgi:hypothetical protein
MMFCRLIFKCNVGGGIRVGSHPICPGTFPLLSALAASMGSF